MRNTAPTAIYPASSAKSVQEKKLRVSWQPYSMNSPTRKDEAATMTFRVKSSKGPAYVIMRNARTGQPVRIPVGVIPKILWPDTWYENPYWQFSGALERADVMEFFGETQREIRIELASKLATYILDFILNIAAAAWLMNPDREGYLTYMRPFLEKLSAIKARARCRKDIMDMTRVCLDYAMDPF